MVDHLALQSYAIKTVKPCTSEPIGRRLKASARRSQSCNTLGKLSPRVPMAIDTLSTIDDSNRYSRNIYGRLTDRSRENYTL